MTGLINSAIVEFYGFANRDGALIRDEIIATLPAYMLMKLKYDVGVEVALAGLPPSVIGIEPDPLIYNTGSGKHIHTFNFPSRLPVPSSIINVSVQTFTWVISDLEKPSGDYSLASLSYVQLSRAKTRAYLSILRPFNPAELQSPLSKDLLDELEIAC